MVTVVVDGVVTGSYRYTTLEDVTAKTSDIGSSDDEDRQAGEPMADRTGWRITSSNSWWSVFGKKRGKVHYPGPTARDDPCAVVDEHGRTRHAFVAERVS
ncbi:integrase [Corynebacterium terpenotabidum Y-11]|uniref:Integrase n=1 Tax=Corynebacterium terpenotabidum Y-11 TaxID=1200352 RepID=S4XBV6_9CORY|nr:integrase [Corynebacterium terpenotabidum Y-11]